MVGKTLEDEGRGQDVDVLYFKFSAAWLMIWWSLTGGGSGFGIGPRGVWSAGQQVFPTLTWIPDGC